MKIRAVIAGLALLMILFSSASLGYAAKSLLNNIHDNPPADEHPWQHGGAPDPGDDRGLSKAPRATIITILPELRIILSIQVADRRVEVGRKATSMPTTDTGEDLFTGAR